MVAITQTQQDRRAAHMADAVVAVAQAKASGDSETVSKLQAVYENAAANARLYAARQDAEAAFNAAHRAYAEHAFNSQTGHATTIARARMLAEQGVTVLPADMLDGEQDPAALREGAALFETLADACR